MRAIFNVAVVLFVSLVVSGLRAEDRPEPFVRMHLQYIYGAGHTEARNIGDNPQLDLNHTDYWGLDLAVGSRTTPWSFMVGRHVEEDDDIISGVRYNVSSRRYLLGLRHDFKGSYMFNRPAISYFQGGIAFMDTRVALPGRAGTEHHTGGWVGAGVAVLLTRNVTLGVDAKWTDADASIRGVNVEQDGTTVGVSIGFAF